MLKPRSAVLTMLQQRANIDREIVAFPRSLIPEASPYSQDDFSPTVRAICESPSCSFISGLRIAKAIIIGDVAVGKTCLVNRFCNHVFDANYKATIGVDFEVERFDIMRIPYNLQIWDTAGQERFKCIAASYYRAAHAIVLVFDVTRPTSLDNCTQWLKEALEVNTRGNINPFIFLVATKTDLMDKDSYLVMEKFAIKAAKRMNAEYWCVSSRTGENVTEFFFRLSALTFDACVLRELEARKTPQIGSPICVLKPSSNYFVCNWVVQ